MYQIQVDGKRYHGYWYSNPSRIVLAGGHRLDGPLVRHEMLHALQGAGSHPRETFLARCDGVVACDGECAVETGGHPTPQPDAPEIPPRGLATLAVVPSAPAASRDSGAVAAIVSVANPHPYAVWVRMTPQAPGDPFAHTFGIVIDYDDPARVGTWGYTFLQSTRFPLGPHETRRWVWDGELSVGRLGIRGYFNVDTAPRIVVNVGP